MGSIYRLVVQSGPEMGAEYLLDKSELYLGRDNSNDLVINDSEVSRRHARLVMEGSTYKIEDLGSTNGTFIRGQRLSIPLMLRPGEIITLGEKIVLRFEIVSADPNATVIADRVSRRVTQSPQVPAPPSIQPTPSVQILPVQISPTPAYQPVSAMPSYPPVPSKKTSSKALIIILIILAILVLFCVIPWIIIDITNSYCVVIPGIINMFFPGACL